MNRNKDNPYPGIYSISGFKKKLLKEIREREKIIKLCDERLKSMRKMKPIIRKPKGEK